MSRKIVITKLQSRKFLMDFSDNICNQISVLADDSTDEAEIQVGNIYIGRVENVVKNINAAFVEISKGVKCYYSLTENNKHIFLNQKNNTSLNIGDRILVQVSREAIKTKPASVSSKIELSGKYVVVSLDVSGVLVSSKIKKNESITQLKEQLLSILEDHNMKDENCEAGFILRTNSCQGSLEDVVLESKHLLNQILDIRRKAEFGMFYECLYRSPCDYCKYINSLPMNGFEKIVTDLIDVYTGINHNVIGLKKEQLQFYEDSMLELHKLYSMENYLKHAVDKKVWLKSGGYLVIEQTEAMSVIDVNSGKQVSKKGGKGNQDDYLEETFLKTNLEAAEEISRQLPMRNLSGIIIVDFINMKNEESQNQLLSFLSKKLKQDSVTTSVVDITKLGLVEITRKNNGKCLAEQLLLK